MKIDQAYKYAREKMLEAGLKNPELEAGILLSAVTEKNREYLLAHPEEKISFWKNFIFQRMLNKRLAGYSSAVLTGHRWFYGLDFMVNKNVLIPRPETELMVEEAIKIITNYKLQIKNVLDVGTGSGCIIVSIAKNLNNTGIKYLGLDISRRALQVARKNASRNGLKSCIHFLYSDLFNSIDKSIFNSPILITANLPYLTLKQINNSPTIQKEPKIALLSGIDGFDHYRRLFSQIRKYSNIGNGNIIILCEIDETQKTGMEKLIAQTLPEAKFEIKKDLAGSDRLVIIKLSKLPIN